MAVYTPVSRDAIEALLSSYDIGELIDHHGISEGVSNTIYYLKTSQGEYLLTLFESHHEEELTAYISLQQYLVYKKYPCQSPVANKIGQILQIVATKPALISTYLSGECLTQPDKHACYLVGLYLAKLHLAAQDFQFFLRDYRDQNWHDDCMQALRPKITEAEYNILSLEYTNLLSLQQLSLPKGTIHTDLFRDNVLFNNNELVGIIDFYYATHDYFIFDLAIAVNDWCRNECGELDNKREKHLLAGYTTVRKITPQEMRYWNKFRRKAAFRFYLSRLYDWYFTQPAQHGKHKDPQEMARIITALK